MVKNNNSDLFCLFSFSCYTYKVLKQIHDGTGISKRALMVCNDFLVDLYLRIEQEAVLLTKLSQRETITHREIQTAVRLVLSGVLAKYAVSAGVKAVASFQSHQEAKEAIDIRPERRRRNRSGLAGLQFPVGRIHTLMKQRARQRIGALAPVYLAAVLEYLAAEIFELSDRAARDDNKIRIAPRHIFFAISNDPELQTLLPNVDIAFAGVQPNIHSMLLPKQAISSDADQDTEDM